MTLIFSGLIACSTSNPEAPGPRAPHPANYFQEHGEAANDDLSAMPGVSRY